MDRVYYLMGQITYGAPASFTESLRREFGISTFIETGTFKGDTSAWAAERFAKVLTIEASEALHKAAEKRFQGTKNVSVFFGDSPSILRRVIPGLKEPALFWLDAHYTNAPDAAGQSGGECPLLDEIAAINEDQHDHFVMIDDARLFITPPPPPHRADEWPNISEVLSALTTGRPERQIMIVHDIIFSAPRGAKLIVAKEAGSPLDFMRNRIRRALQREA